MHTVMVGDRILRGSDFGKLLIEADAMLEVENKPYVDRVYGLEGWG